MAKRPTRFAGGLAILVASGVAASSAQQARDRHAVYVVALKDSGLLTMCPAIRETTMNAGESWKADGRALADTFAEDLQLLRFPPREPGSVDRGTQRELRDDPRYRTELGRTQVILPTPWTSTPDAKPTTVRAELGRDRVARDPALEATVELELLKLDRVDAVHTPSAADLVLLVEGTYVALATSVTPDYVTRESDQAPPPLVTTTHVGDWSRNVLQSILAIAVPADVYRATRGEVHAILKARTWEGSEIYQPPYQVSDRSAATRVTRWESRRTWAPASPEAIVWQFLKMKPRPASHPPLCAAFAPGTEVGTPDPPTPSPQEPNPLVGTAVTSMAEPREPTLDVHRRGDLRRGAGDSDRP